MRGFRSVVLLTLAVLGHVSGAPTPLKPRYAPAPVNDKRSQPTVSIASGKIVGSSGSGTDNFNGIPFALPPTGNLRLKPPARLNSSLGTFQATGVAAACPQMYLSTESGGFITEILGDVIDLPFFQTVTLQSENCLTLNVIRPSGTTSTSKLPVLFWIFGGGFEVSSSPSPSSRIGNPAG